MLARKYMNIKSLRPASTSIGSSQLVRPAARTCRLRPHQRHVCLASPAPPGSDPEVVTQGARVDTGDAIEQLQLPVSSPHSSLVTVTLRSPMGLVLEESAPACVQVAEVVPGGAAATAQVRVGDRVRAVTAATMQMTYPTVNLLLGGVGRPRLKRVALPATGRSLAWVSGALRSNADLEGGQATLVLERSGGAEQQQQQQQQGGQGQAQGEREAEAEGAGKDAGGSIFDPSLFE